MYPVSVNLSGISFLIICPKHLTSLYLTVNHSSFAVTIPCGNVSFAACSLHLILSIHHENQISIESFFLFVSCRRRDIIKQSSKLFLVSNVIFLCCCSLFNFILLLTHLRISDHFFPSETSPMCNLYHMLSLLLTTMHSLFLICFTNVQVV